MAPHVERVCVRGDTDFSLTASLDRWSEEADFIFGYDSQPGMLKQAEALEAGDWERLERRPRYTSRTQDAEQAGGREGADRAGARLRQQAANYEDVAEYITPAGEVPQDLPDSCWPQEHQQDEGEA